MTKQFAITYDLNGRGRLFITTLTRAGALALFKAHFPTARVVRCEVAS